MILEKENILAEGREFRFKTAPIDPNDPFRGKFITLNFAANSIEVENDSDYHSDETVFVSIANNDSGFAQIVSISKERPVDDSDYVEARVRYVSGETEPRVYIQYPFTTILHG